MSNSRLVVILSEALDKDSADLVVLMGFMTRLDKEEVKVVDNHSETSSKSLRNSLAAKVAEVTSTTIYTCSISTNRSCG